MSNISSVSSCIPTPKAVFAGVESVAKIAKRLADAVRNSITIVANTRLLAGLPELSPSVSQASKNLGFIAIPLIPFEIVKFSNKIQRLLTADDWTACGRATLETFADISSLVNKLVAPYKLLKTLEVIGSVPMIPFLNLIGIPCAFVRSGLDIWDITAKGRTFSIIRSGASQLDDNESALQQLAELEKADLKEVSSHLGLSKKCEKQYEIATIVNQLKSKLLNNEEGALEDTKEFYAKLKNRSTLTYSIGLVETTLNIGSLAITLLLLPIPFAPVAALGFAAASMNLGTFTIWAGKGLFMKDEIFNPNAKCGAYAAYETVKNAGSNVHNFCMQKVFGQAA